MTSTIVRTIHRFRIRRSSSIGIDLFDSSSRIRRRTASPGGRRTATGERTDVLRIVVQARTWGLSNEAEAERFVVDPCTIGRWLHEAAREPDKDTIGSLLRPVPPVNSVDDVTRELVALLDRMHIGGRKRIAQLLTRARRTISTESVRRIRKSPQPATPPSEAPLRSARSSALHATKPNHVWMTDITSIPSLVKLWSFKLVVVLDVFSRYPLAFGVFPSEPSSEGIAALVRESAKRFGSPKHFVTDRGSQFTGEAFVSTLRELGVAQRFGAIGKSGSIAIIERFWRSMKEMIDSRFMPPLSLRHLHDKVDRALFYYATLRPHQGLAGATPTEVYFGITTASGITTSEADFATASSGTSRPRRCARDPSVAGELPFEIAWLDPERRLPFLVPTRRAA